MNRINRKWMLGMAWLCAGAVLANLVSAQEVKIHSHNDYDRRVPFYQAYSQQAASIEADIYATENEGELLVAHNREDLPQAPTLYDAYLHPLLCVFEQNDGRAWRKSEKTLILLIDLKMPAHPTLDLLVDKLKAWPAVFDPAVNPYAVHVVISGERPDPQEFAAYPPYIFFDGSNWDYTTEQLKRIYLYSFNFSDYAKWNGDGDMPDGERVAIVNLIEAAHALDKPIRFYGTPDKENVWRMLHTLGADYINTDRPEACTAFFRSQTKK